MPTLVVAILDDEDLEWKVRIPLGIQAVLVDVNADELRKSPIESVLELSVRPAAIRAIRAWLDASTSKAQT